MCEAVSEKHPGWKGWMEVPAPKISGAAGAWIELSHPLTEMLSRAPMFPPPRIRQILTKPEHPANVTEVHMVVHHGTHLDAPRHFIADGPTMDEVPLERLIGQGVVWRVEVPDHGVIETSHLQRATPALHEGDIVLIDTGRARHINTAPYDDHASLSPEAAQWLVDHGAKLVGIDCSTPDLASNRRPQGFDWPVHPHPAQSRRPDRRAHEQSGRTRGTARGDHVPRPQHRRLGRRAGAGDCARHRLKSAERTE